MRRRHESKLFRSEKGWTRAPEAAWLWSGHLPGLTLRLWWYHARFWWVSQTNFSRMLINGHNLILASWSRPVFDRYQSSTVRFGLSASRKTTKMVKTSIVLIFSRIKFREKEVALFYLRAGYDPSCYECRNCSSLADANKMTEKSWENRLQIEKSRAIKSPSIEYHLLTNKLFQGIMQ